MKLYRCGWNVPADIPPTDMVEKWPENMEGWRTGEGSTYTTWVGAVWAENAGEAIKTIRSCYGVHHGRIPLRWLPEEIEDSWTPGDRFPSHKLKKPTELPSVTLAEPTSLWKELQK